MWHHQSPFIVYGYVEMKNVERNGFLIQGLSWLSKSSIRNFWVWKIMGNEAWKDEQKADTAEKFVTNFSQVLTISPELIFSKCPNKFAMITTFWYPNSSKISIFLGQKSSTCNSEFQLHTSSTQYKINSSTNLQPSSIKRF